MSRVKPPTTSRTNSTMAPPAVPTARTTSRTASSSSSTTGNSNTASSHNEPPSRSNSPARVPRKTIGGAGAGPRIKSANQAASKDQAADEGNGEMNIQVIVRCRGRSAMEISQRTPIITNTSGAVSSSITIETPSVSAINNTAGMGLGVTTTLPYSDRAPVSRTYSFDRVFGPEADQTCVYREVVEGMLDEVLAGYNCTIFAYGQTGTGKTYTMQGDLGTTAMNTPVADAGIIPRVLHRLFTLLDAVPNSEYSVKCSYIELYNEELRDLLASDFQQPTALGGHSTSGQPGGLKIYDDANKKGVNIQGLEETGIRNAQEGLALLHKGSQRRQVAETKMNTESSRSHSIFNLTVHMKESSGNGGEDLLKVGKLNLVDLAGSEAIGRSGAENKRAREAGMINQSLLTLGRVISALVEKSSHIPYRESKLTRLLQDSLGGRTKTCIVATISPTRSNMEETLSTLDYAVRAKSIRNKPEVNQRMTKGALIKEYMSEIDRLKSDLMASHDKNGIYFSSESWKDMSEEHERCKAELADASQRADAMDLKHTTLSEEFEKSMGLLKAQEDEIKVAREEAAKLHLLVAEVKAGLEIARVDLDQEKYVSEAYRRGEANVNQIAEGLKTTVVESVQDVGGLFAKIARKADVLAANTDLTGSYSLQLDAAAEQLQKEIHALKKVQTDFGKTLQSELQGFGERGAKSLEDDKQLLDARLETFVQDVTSFERLNAEHETKTTELSQDMITLQSEFAAKIGNWQANLKESSEQAAARLLEQNDCNMRKMEGAMVHLAEMMTVLIDGALEQSENELKSAREMQSMALTAANAEITRLEARNAKLENMLSSQSESTSNMQQELVKQISTLIAGFTANQATSLQQSVAEIKQDQLNSVVELERFTAENAVHFTKTEQRFDIYKNDLDQLKSAAAAQTEEGKQVCTEASDLIRQQGETNIQAVQSAIADLDGQMNAQATAVATSLQGSSTEISRFKDAYRQEMGTMTDQVRDTYAAAKERLVVAKEDIKVVSGAVLKAHLEAEPIFAEQCDHAVSHLAGLRDAHSSFMANVKQDLPTGQTPRKKAWPIATSWSTTAPRDLLVQRFQRSQMYGGDVEFEVVEPIIEDVSQGRSEVSEQSSLGLTMAAAEVPLPESRANSPILVSTPDSIPQENIPMPTEIEENDIVPDVVQVQTKIPAPTKAKLTASRLGKSTSKSASTAVSTSEDREALSVLGDSNLPSRKPRRV